MEKKEIAILILCGIFIASLIMNMFNAIFPRGPGPPGWTPPDPNTLIYGTDNGPKDLDPMDAWDSSSFNVQDQVCEGLFGYNYTDPEMTIIPKLAKDFGLWEGSNYTVELRDDVWFHDGTKFDAAAAKWNFDRLDYLMGHGLAKAGELFQYFDVPSNSTKNIINKTLVVGQHILKFICNSPYGPFEALLCFNAAYMLSPISTPFEEPIDTATGDLVGTGPFIYDRYEAGVEVLFHAWDYYWGPRTKINVLIYSIINDALIRNKLLLSKDIDLLSHPLITMISNFTNNQGLKLINQGTTTTIRFLGFNNNRINITFRKAISYTIDYKYILEDVYSNACIKLNSCIPPGILYSKSYNELPSLNISKARKIMQSMGFGEGWDTSYPGMNESEWTSASFDVYNTSYFSGTFNEEIYANLSASMKLIGLEISDARIAWYSFNYCDYYWYLFPDCSKPDIFMHYYIPSYNDPHHLINFLFNNQSNLFNYNGYQSAKDLGRDPFNIWDNTQLLIELASSEINQSLRQVYYNRIQELIIKDIPWAYGLVFRNYDACKIKLKGFPSNPMDKVYFYPCYWDNLFED